MNPNTFDRISKLFAERKLSRRQALATGGAGIAAAGLAATGLHHAAAQDASPEATSDEQTTYLFVQSFQSGSITPIENQEGRFAVTLERGTGQTIYFGDRPSRDVGATDTALFLQTLGFPDDNPPNAALIVETAPGETDVAVVELFNPTIDVDTDMVTYDVEVLNNWRNDLELGLQEDPTDLAALAPVFGAAHLLIDDCPDGCTEAQVQGIFDCPSEATVSCLHWNRDGGNTTVGRFEGIDTCMNWSWCMPCEPYGHTQPDTCATKSYWNDKCNAEFPACEGRCEMTVSTYWLTAPCS